jgi:hypothetical protein
MLVAVAVVAVVQPTVVVVVAVVVQPTVVVVVQPTVVVVVVVVQPTVVVPVMWTRSSRCWFGHRRLAVELTARVTASSRQLGVQATTSRASSRCCA